MGGQRSARAAPRLAVLIIVSLFVAGCTGGSKPQSGPNLSANPAEFDETTGGIEGIVVDEEASPVASAQVGILSLEFVTSTDAAGKFTFSKVQPGPHTLDVTAPGFHAGRQEIEVVAGEVVHPEVTIAAMAVDGPHSTLVVIDGFISCGTGTYVVTQVACGAGDPNQKFLFKYNITSNMSGVLWEQSWQSTQALSKDLVLRIEKEGCGAVCPNDDRFGSDQGCCYLRIFREGSQLDIPGVKAHSENKAIQSRTFPAFSTEDNLPTVYTSQSFRIYVEYFYGDLPPDMGNHTNMPD